MNRRTTVRNGDDREAIWWLIQHSPLPVVETQAESADLDAQEASPRTAAPFARPQRWLMTQAILAAYFRNEAREAGSGLLSQHFVNLAVSHNLASRNTPPAFINEMRKYGIVNHMADCESKALPGGLNRQQNTLAMSLQWLAVHLATLDGLDGGGRSAALRKQPSRFGSIQPLIADGLLASRAIRRSTEKFSLLKWIDDGGIVMDRLIAGCPQDPAGLERIPTDVMSVSGLARRLNLSRSQLSRKFAIVEAMGSLRMVRGPGANRRCGCQRNSGARIMPHRQKSSPSSTPLLLPFSKTT